MSRALLTAFWILALASLATVSASSALAADLPGCVSPRFEDNLKDYLELVRLSRAEDDEADAMAKDCAYELGQMLIDDAQASEYVPRLQHLDRMTSQAPEAYARLGYVLQVAW